MTSSTNLPSFVEPPVSFRKLPTRPSRFHESSIKRRRPTTLPNHFISSPRKASQPNVSPSNFVAPNGSVTMKILKKRPPRRQVQPGNPSKSFKAKEVTSTQLWDHPTDFHHDGEFETFSPVKPRDNIDWSISSAEIEELQLRVVPYYWQLLVESFCSIVRVTDRLYILQNWDYKKQQLKVHTWMRKINLQRLISIDMYSEWWILLRFMVHPAIVVSRLLLSVYIFF